MIPQVDNKSEEFDLNLYKSIKLEGDFETLGVSKKTHDGYLELIKTSQSATSKETKNNVYFTITKSYYLNNNIKKKGLFFNVSWGGFKKGIWYEFDEQGNLKKETNYDKSYQFNFDDILTFCKKNGIPVDKGPILQSTGYHTMIKRNEDVEKSGAVWEIRWLKEPDLEEIIKLDGKTGKVLERREQGFINN